MDPKDVASRIRTLATGRRRLRGPSHRQPERFLEDKDEPAHELAKLADQIAPEPKDTEGRTPEGIRFARDLTANGNRDVTTFRHHAEFRIFT